MAKDSVAPKSQVRPARDPAAPWAANAARQAREATGERSVVYCVTVEGLPLLKIGRTSQLKKRMSQLSGIVGRNLHIAYWAEFTTEDAKDIERCALLFMRRHFDSEGEWSLAEPLYGANAIKCATDFMGVRPEYEAGSPAQVDVEDEYRDLRDNKMPTKLRAHDAVDRAYWEQPFVINKPLTNALK